MNDPIFDQLKNFLNTVPYGQALVKRHEGNNALLDVYVSETVKYKTNEEAAAQLLQLIKEYADNEFTGEMNFTLKFHNGKINEVQRHGHRRIVDKPEE